MVGILKLNSHRLLATCTTRPVLGSFRKMALSRFEYVKSFETEDKLEPLHWILVRLRVSNEEEVVATLASLHEPQKSFRDAMSISARSVVGQVKELALAYGYKNVFNFVLKQDTTLYKRRASKLVSNLTSLFSSCLASEYFDHGPIRLPVVDGSLYHFPQDQCLRDFLTREQNCCHEINLEETTVRNLVKVAGWDYADALQKAKNASEGEKNELLFSLCNLNYNNEPDKYKKGTIFVNNRFYAGDGQDSVAPKKRKQTDVAEEIHADFYKEAFWESFFVIENQTKMNCKYTLLNSFQRRNQILPHAFLVVRIDGKGFHKFSELHNFRKPNDDRSLSLMTASAKAVLDHFPFARVAYGQSDEYSFLFRRYGHREKEGHSLISRVVSVFTGTFVQGWREHFKEQAMLAAPSFDARLVVYPTPSSLKDYLSWRQVDCHINNMYNTCFWALVQEKALSPREAQEYLKGTFSKDKLAILRDEFGMEYDEVEALYRKGTVLLSEVRGEGPTASTSIVVQHENVIDGPFWQANNQLLELEPS